MNSHIEKGTYDFFGKTITYHGGEQAFDSKGKPFPLFILQGLGTLQEGKYLKMVKYSNHGFIPYHDWNDYIPEYAMTVYSPDTLEPLHYSIGEVFKNLGCIAITRK